jgi:lipid A 3-O-deacylase
MKRNKKIFAIGACMNMPVFSSAFFEKCIVKGLGRLSDLKMKAYLHYFLLASTLLVSGMDNLRAQSSGPSRLFRVYEDNDFLNIRGKGTDQAYSNGIRFDQFFTKKHPSRFFIDKWMPVAGDSSINVFGWGLMQKMVTPSDISKTFHQPNDYAYAGALFVTHTLFSYNQVKKYNLQTEIILGIRGTTSLARETQTVIHKLINYQKPMGWDHQLKTLPFVNINFTAEKQLLGYGNFIELNGGAQLAAGNMLQAFGFYPMIRIGKMAPYFNGFLGQYSTNRSAKKGKKSQLYLLFKPKTTFVFRNALMHGKKMNADRQDENGLRETSNRRVRHRLTEIEYGAVFAHGNFSIACTQTHSTEYNKGLYHHNVGNISLFFSR